jgi:hypothetical protein
VAAADAPVCRLALPRSKHCFAIGSRGALPRCFRCSSRKLSAGIRFSPQEPRLAGYSDREKQQRASLLSAVFDTHQNRPVFIDFRTPSIPLSPATARHGRAGPPVFAENLQALAIPLRSSRAVLTTVAYNSVIPMTDY